jgi:hypothetical protein
VWIYDCCLHPSLATSVATSVQYIQSSQPTQQRDKSEPTYSLCNTSEPQSNASTKFDDVKTNKNNTEQSATTSTSKHTPSKLSTHTEPIGEHLPSEGTITTNTRKLECESTFISRLQPSKSHHTTVLPNTILSNQSPTADANGVKDSKIQNVNRNKIHNSKFTIISANANSVKNKMTSLKFNIDQLKPHVVVVQETKLKKKSPVDLIKGYRTFTTVRGDNGGGLMIACLASLDPVMVYEGDSECEVLVVQIALESKLIRIIAGYGPQECAPLVVRETYRNTIEEQVVRAQMAGCSVIAAEDANAKLGSKWLKDDPNDISENGKLLEAMVVRQEMMIINCSTKCSGGPITRQRKKEASCIDYIIISQDLYHQFNNAIIDSDQLYVLTKYTTTKGITSVKRSDHYTIIETEYTAACP